MPNPWTEDRKLKARERIRLHKPWLKSTGPRTAEGKKRSAMNSRKRGYYSQEARDIRRTLRSGARYLRQVRERLCFYRQSIKYVIAATQNPDGSWKFYCTFRPELWPEC